MTVTARGCVRQRRLLGFLTGASAILAIACSPSGSTPGMRAALTPAPPAAGQAGLTGSVSPVTEASKGCAGRNAEVETATAAPDYVYDLWIGCRGIGYARSSDGGLHFGA